MPVNSPSSWGFKHTRVLYGQERATGWTAGRRVVCFFPLAEVFLNLGALSSACLGLSPSFRGVWSNSKMTSPLPAMLYSYGKEDYEEHLLYEVVETEMIKRSAECGVVSTCSFVALQLEW